MQVLTDNGWRMYYSCFCGGSLKEYYINKKYPGYEIRVRPKKNTFSIFLNNLIIHGPDFHYKLNDSLTRYGINS
jgi:hypothetical protein